MPDYRDRFLVAVGSKYSVGQTGGSDSVTLSESQMPSHSHDYALDFEYIFTCNEDSMSGVDADIPGISESGENTCRLSVVADGPGDANPSRGIQNYPTSSEGGNQPVENRPSYIAVKWMIKAK